MTAVLNVHAARVEALFVSTVQPSDKPSREQVTASIEAMVRVHGTRTCAAKAAAEFADHPELALPRWAWARDVVDDTWPPRGAGRG